ncbi:MAG TPA: hypothetical protein VIN08_14390 [Ohtaekwangia sp.]|uniref:hypothetical protein n=1 Tax=Ohtaekwangia sp. TaxID=2066019 RepID=UPI002F92B614
MKKLLISFAVLLCIGCSKKESSYTVATEFLPGKRLAELKKSKLDEVSDLAASVNNPGMLWAHNDSGNGADVYLVNEDLDIKLTCKLKDIDNRDWEDMTVGPGPDPNKTYIYIGDIGDNNARYEYKYIYRFEEPVLKPGEDKRLITSFDTICFKLPDRKKDTEALFIDPATKDLYVVSKREEPVVLYTLRYPYATNDTITATSIMTLPLKEIVAGDMSADGKNILLKNYYHIYWWSASGYKPVSALLQEKPKEVPYKEEYQGESIAWARDGSGFYTISEKGGGEKSYLYFYQRSASK